MPSTDSRPPFMASLQAWKCGGGSAENRKHRNRDKVSDISDAFDLTFFCSDGIVSSHRLVISNVSKYIMSMLDDQPPWYPTSIHVLDFPKTIIQILVDLAYTGEMRFPQDLQSDVFDAMQTLGWVHTDNLSADFYEDPPKDGDESTVLKKRDAGTPFKGTKPKAPTPKTPQSPLTPHRTESFSYNDSADVDESMEISNLPSIDLSDDDNSVSAVSVKVTSARKVFTGAFDGEKTFGLQNDFDGKSISVARKSRSSSEKTPDENIQPSDILQDDNPKSPSRRSSRRASRRISESNPEVVETETESAGQMSIPNIEVETTKAIRKGRRPVTSANTTSVPEEPSNVNGMTAGDEPSLLDETSQMSGLSSESSTVGDSPSKRQRRKPKRFDDEDDIPPTPSPEKSKLKDKVVRGRKKTVPVAESNETVQITVSDAEPVIIANSDIKKRRGATGTPKKIETRAAAVTPKKVETNVNTKTPVSKKTPKKKQAALTLSSGDEGFEKPKSEGAKPDETKSQQTTKKRLSAEGLNKSSLITSYFNKAPPGPTTPTATGSTETEVQILEATVVKPNRGGRPKKSVSTEQPNPSSSTPAGKSKPEKKKRTFDQISVAAAGGSGGEEVVVAGNEAAATPAESAATPLPVRKSVRAGSRSRSKNASTDKTPSEAVAEELEEVDVASPKRKRVKQEGSVEGSSVEEIKEPLPVAISTRRSSKK